MDTWLIILGAVGLGAMASGLKSNPEGKDPGDPYDDEGKPVAVLPGGSVEVDNSLTPDYCFVSYAESAGTRNFALHEFACKDLARTPVPKMLRGNVQRLMNVLEVVRAYFGGKQVIINSGYRTPEHNRKVGGVEDSLHKCAGAVDFTVVGVPPAQVQTGMEYLMITGQIPFGGLGKYNTFTHYDIGAPRTWNNRK